MTERNLIVMVGLPYSGKSTWARAQNLPIVSADALRLAMGHKYYAPLEDLVWTLAKMMVRSLFLAGNRKVIADGCHATQKRRDFWTPMTLACSDVEDGWTTEFLHIPTDASECRRRAEAAGDRHILGVIDRMAGEMDFTGCEAVTTTGPVR